jgi:hypothetical protein
MIHDELAQGNRQPFARRSSYLRYFTGMNTGAP